MIKTERSLDIIYTFEKKHVMFSIDSGIAIEEEGVVDSFVDKSFTVKFGAIKSDISVYKPNASFIFTHSEQNSFYTWSSQLISFNEHLLQFKLPKNFYQVDRREYSRISVKPRTVKITVFIDEKTIVQGYLKDISFGGIGVELTQGGLLDYKGITAYFKIEFPNACASGTGIITASFNAGRNVGIRFTDITEEARKVMQDFILYAKTIETQHVTAAEVRSAQQTSSEKKLSPEVALFLSDTHEKLDRIARKTVYYLSTVSNNELFNRLSMILNEKYVLKKATSLKHDDNAAAYLIDIDTISNLEMIIRNIKSLYQHSPVKVILVGDMITKDIVIQASKCCVTSIIKLPIESDLAISKILTALEQ